MVWFVTVVVVELVGLGISDDGSGFGGARGGGWEAPGLVSV